MFHSRSFLSRTAKVQKLAETAPDSYREELRELFARHLPSLPTEMVGDLFSHCMSTRDTSDQQVQALADMLDLLREQYDDTNDPLGSGDWEAVRDTIDEYAVELEMPLVQYVMERVVSHRAI